MLVQMGSWFLTDSLLAMLSGCLGYESPALIHLSRILTPSMQETPLLSAHQIKESNILTKHEETLVLCYFQSHVYSGSQLNCDASSWMHGETVSCGSCLFSDLSASFDTIIQGGSYNNIRALPIQTVLQLCPTEIWTCPHCFFPYFYCPEGQMSRWVNPCGSGAEVLNYVAGDRSSKLDLNLSSSAGVRQLAYVSVAESLALSIVKLWGEEQMHTLSRWNFS